MSEYDRRNGRPDGSNAAGRRRYRVRHPEAVLVANREHLARFRAANPDANRLAAAKFRRDHPERVWASNARIRALRKEAPRLGPVARLAVLEFNDGMCGICGGDVDPARFHVDHIVSLSDGGSHTYDNVQVAHPSCNAAKH